MMHIRWTLLLAAVGCAGTKQLDTPSEEGAIGGSYVVSGDDNTGSLGEDDGGSGGSGDGSGDGGSGDGGSGDGSSGDGGSGDGGSGDGGSGDGGSGDGAGDGDDGGDPTGGTGDSETDADGDGFTADADCDDSDPDTYPGAVEYCDGIDTDCDGSRDAGAIDKVTSYEDADGDGYGNPDVSLWACSVPADHVLNADDCDDTDASRNPVDGCSWDGTYTGTIAVTATISGISDTCSATLDLDVDETASPAAVGDGTCSWAGLAAGILGDIDFEVDGDFTSTDDIEGDITIDGFGSETWTGTFSSPDNLYGTASGSGTFEGFAYTYTMELDLYR